MTTKTNIRVLLSLSLATSLLLSACTSDSESDWEAGANGPGSSSNPSAQPHLENLLDGLEPTTPDYGDFEGFDDPEEIEAPPTTPLPSPSPTSSVADDETVLDWLSPRRHGAGNSGNQGSVDGNSSVSPGANPTPTPPSGVNPVAPRPNPTPAPVPAVPTPPASKNNGWRPIVTPPVVTPQRPAPVNPAPVNPVAPVNPAPAPVAPAPAPVAPTPTPTAPSPTPTPTPTPTAPAPAPVAPKPTPAPSAPAQRPVAPAPAPVAPATPAPAPAPGNSPAKASSASDAIDDEGFIIGELNTSGGQINQNWIVKAKWNSEKDRPTLLTPALKDSASIRVSNALTIRGFILSTGSNDFTLATRSGDINASAECVGAPMRINILRGSAG